MIPRFVAVMFILLFTALMAGCGGSSSSTAATVTKVPSTVSLTATDVSGKTFYSVPPNATSSAAIVTYTFDQASQSATGTPTQAGQWNIVNGAIVYLDAGSVQHTFTCLQQEATYWLMYDENNRISRFYFDNASAQSYLGTIVVTTVTPNGVLLGGAVQGTTLPATFKNVSTAAGSPAGVAGIDNSTYGTLVAATDARFTRPLGIATDGTYLYVADTFTNTIRKIDLSTMEVTRLAGSQFGAAGYVNSTDGTGNTALFNNPADITTDGTYLYVADTGNNRICKVDKVTGNVTTLAGSSAGTAGAVDADNGANAQFYRPYGITTDGTNLYVADNGNHLIRKIVLSGTNAVYTLAGSPGAIGTTDGTGTAARFRRPTHITTDGSNLYVVDFANSTIRKIVIATGGVTTLAGSPGNQGFADGTASEARFYDPNGITTDGTNLYVTDSATDLYSNDSINTATNNIRKIIISTGVVSTIAGVAGENGGYVNSADGTARFNYPSGITTDGTSLYVTDSLNNVIRRLQ